MIEFEPTLEPTGAEEQDFSAKLCIDGVADTVARFLADKDRVTRATTPLEPEEKPKSQSMADIYERDKGKPEYTFIGRIN